MTDLAVVRGDRPLFSDVTFSVAAGEMLYVQGANGSGKTTLLRMLCGLITPEAGVIRWCGQNIRQLREEYCRELFYFGHLNAIKDELSGLENLRMATRLSGQPASESEAVTALAQVGLDGYEDLPAKVLSQGQRRRVALARLLLTSARLWILDEPFTALDSKAVDQLRATISRHLQAQGLVVLTTHQEVAVDSAVVRQIRMGV